MMPTLRLYVINNKHTEGRGKQEELFEVYKGLLHKETAMTCRTLPHDWERNLFGEDEELNRKYHRGKAALLTRKLDDDVIRMTTSPDAATEQLVESVRISDDCLSRQFACPYCRDVRRLENMSNLKPGMHIYLSGQMAKFKTSKGPIYKQVSLYKHHVIVKCVELIHSASWASVRVIHFNRLDRLKCKIVEESVEYDLRFDEIYVVSYKNSHAPDKIISRAESCLDCHKTYNVITYNCEHFATWCVSGTETSFQAQSVVESLSEMLSEVVGHASGNIIRLILRAAHAGTDEAAAAAGTMSLTPTIAVGVSAGLYLLYCIVKTIYLTKNKGICKNCLKRQLLQLWVRFGVYLGTSGASLAVILLVIPLLSQPVGFVILGVLVFLSVGCVLAVPKLMKCLESPFRGQMHPAKLVSDIKRGDVVTFKYWGLCHDFLVTRVQDDSPKSGELSVVHYSRTCLFGPRVVREESLGIDLETKEVNIHDYSGYQTYSRNEAIRRARSRIGEKKHNPCDNRSSHLCHWAKTKVRPIAPPPVESDHSANKDSERKGPLSTLLVDEFWIKNRDDFYEGDVVRVKKLTGSSKGICTQITTTSDHGVSCLKISVVFLEKSRVVEKSCGIDLRHDDIWVYRYHPSHCVSRNERLINALGSIERKISPNGGMKFVLDCVLKKIIRGTQ